MNINGKKNGIIYMCADEVSVKRVSWRVVGMA
jgi:hypothetical protein